jgi:ATP-dependent DNA helicase RecG
MFLAEYQQEVTRLKGIGPVAASRLARLGITTVKDLVRHYPREYQDRRRRDCLSQAVQGERINAVVEVRGKEWVGKGYKKLLKVRIGDATGEAFLVCFGRPYLDRQLGGGREYHISGAFSRRFGALECSNFEIEEVRASGSLSFDRILPVYALTEGLNQQIMRRMVARGLEAVSPRLEEELPPELKRAQSLPDKIAALQAIHNPDSWEQLEQARRALVYEELLTYLLLLEQSLAARRSRPRKRNRGGGELKASLLERLSFRLTAEQSRVLAEIESDLAAPIPAARLLQGEVGSGKTLVALLSALTVIEAGEQAALLAPTELLARQHAETAARLLEPLGIRVGFLSGGTRQEGRRNLVRALENGEIDLLIGTHALYSEDIRYHRLGLVIVDEQHRFGVRQRERLVAKGSRPDLLMMTATPIPRTLALSVFGDLDLSEIRELPEGRWPVITHLTAQGNERKVYERVRQELKRGRQAYFVYPLIEDSPVAGLKNAESMYHRLRTEIFPNFRLALIHSRIGPERQREIMSDFARRKVDALVATSVMEVGVDIPNATCIVIEHAERFGLSNLHQLRGRVGRGGEQSYAFLIYSRELTEEGVERLKVIKEVSDGFKISEEDLRIRGPGEFLGVRQSGFLKLGLADLVRDQSVFVTARQDARRILAADPGLMLPQHRGLRTVLAAGDKLR